jgi:phosphoserine phosphatase RsbU/P
MRIDKGGRLVLFTDGLSEGLNPQGEEFGVQRLSELIRAHHLLPARELVHSCVSKASEFRSGVPAHDDLTVMVIERIE